MRKDIILWNLKHHRMLRSLKNLLTVKPLRRWLGFSPLLLLTLFISLFVNLCNFSSVSAVSVGPSKFGLYYRDTPSGDFQWNLDLYAGQNYSVQGFRVMDVRVEWSQIAFTGNHASLTSEINVVAINPTSPCTYPDESGSYPQCMAYWFQFQYQRVHQCAVVGVGNVTIAQQNWNYAITNWTASDGSYRSTMTMYIDVTLSGLPQGSSGKIACLVGGLPDYMSFGASRGSTAVRWYVEKAPAIINFSNNIDDALLQTQIQQNSTIINQNSQIIQGQQAQTDAINAQTQAQNNQYNQEKQEEAQREESAQDSADQLGGMFNFTVPNPVAGLLGMFSPPDGCVNIPIISSMVRSTDTQYCPWFPASVRNILTPVIGLISVVFIFGFIVAWLNGNDANGSITIKGGIH